MSGSTRYYRSKGQALIETLLVSAFILVPLMVWGPMLGKYLSGVTRIDRLGSDLAWERTVWSQESEDLQDVTGWRHSTSANAGIAERDMGRLSKTVLDAGVGGRADSLDSESNTLFDRPYWKYHYGDDRKIFSSMTTPQAGDGKVGTLGYEVFGIYNSVVGAVKSIPLLGAALGDFGELNHPLGSRFDNSLSIRLRPPAAGLAEDYTQGLSQELVLKSRGELVTRQWSAQDNLHFHKRTRDFVPASLIQGSAVFQELMKGLSFQVPAFDAFFIKTPAISIGSSIGPLRGEFGSVDTRPVPDAAPNCRYGSGKKSKSIGSKGKAPKGKGAKASTKAFGMCRFEGGA